MPGLQGSLQEGLRPFGTLGRTPASLTEQGYAFGNRYWQQEDAQEGGDDGRQEDWNTVRASAAVYMTDTLSSELSGISDEIEKLVYKEFWNMVYAEDEEELEAIWQAMTASVRRAGMDSLARFYREAWSRALERAEKYEESGAS